LLSLYVAGESAVRRSPAPQIQSKNSQSIILELFAFRKISVFVRIFLGDPAGDDRCAIAQPTNGWQLRKISPEQRRETLSEFGAIDGLSRVSAALADRSGRFRSVIEITLLDDRGHVEFVAPS
jgi:hypothetical protein